MDVHYHGQVEIYLYYGLNHITVFANDSAGGTATCSLDLYYDPYPPVIEFTYLPDGSYLNDVPVEITWTFVEYMPFLRDAPLVDMHYRIEGRTGYAPRTAPWSSRTWRTGPTTSRSRPWTLRGTSV